MILDLHHIQIAMPEGGEPAAIAFYCGVLGFDEVAKPASLSGRGGVWLEAGNVRVHLGVETDFRPARKAHPGFRVADLDEAIARLARHGVACRRDIDLPAMTRIYVDDPFGNRIELLELHSPGEPAT